MKRELLSELLEIALPQAGCFSLDQARRLGISGDQIRRLVASGIVLRAHPRAFRIASSVSDEHAAVWLSFLQAGDRSVVTHEAALQVHGVQSVPFTPVVSLPPGDRHDLSGIRVHRFGDLLDEHVADIGGLRVTTVVRSVVDVASVFSKVRLADLVDRVTITERRCGLNQIARVYRQINRRGRKNIQNLAEVLEERTSPNPTPRSVLERRMDGLIEAAEMPEPRNEMPVPNTDGLTGRVDRAWPEAKLILEIDGRTWHSRERSMRNDRERDRAAGLAGWHTVRVLDEEVRDQPGLVTQDLLGIYEVRLRQFNVPGAGTVPDEAS